MARPVDAAAASVAVVPPSGPPAPRPAPPPPAHEGAPAFASGTPLPPGASGWILPSPGATTGPAADPGGVAQGAIVDIRTSRPPTPTFSTGAELMFTSAYVWRGFVNSRDWSLQPDLWLKFRDVSLHSWMNVIGEGSTPVTEHDFTVDYTKEAGELLFSAGFTNYVYGAAQYGRTTNELYAGVTHQGFLSPSVRVFYDFHAGTGAYVLFGATHTLPVSRRVTATPGVTLGYNNRLFIPEATFSDLNIGVRFDAQTASDGLAVVPFLRYSRSLNRGLFDDQFYGGVGLSMK
jgi:hypothetical protein